MDIPALALHVANFLAPAAAVAIGLALLRGLFAGRGGPLPGRLLLVFVNFACGALVLLLGLWIFGVDGKMATYAGLVLACATAQWVLLRAWSR